MTAAWATDPVLAAACGATLLPFASSASILLGLRASPRASALLSLLAAALSFACALFLLTGGRSSGGSVEYAARWVGSGEVTVPFGFLLDPLSLLMLATVATVTLLVQVYSLGYMAGDPGFGRYYGYLSLFAGAMSTLTLSSNLLQLYVFWELVGISSYLLIGFWYEKFSATEAGKKAFVMTRTGDVGFFLGLLLLLVHLGDVGFRTLAPRAAALLPPGLLTACALLVFCGIVGKSAQFPLMTWLPDAMEGPTPVSALLHSATMVAAGVFLLARLFPFFQLSPTAMTVILATATVSMLLASTMALGTRDLKRIWAYSTISQLGLMLMGLAAGGYFAGVFHLGTHAAFKALLFLASGILIHRFGTNDVFELRERGGGRLRVPAAGLLIGAAALSGLPPLSGFYSKEALLADLSALPNRIWLSAGLLGAFLTAYYAFRPIFVLLSARTPEAAPEAHAGGKHARGEGAMTVPVVVLSLLALLLGLGSAPLREYLLGGPEAAGHGTGAPWLPYVATGAALAGVVLAWLEFGRGRAPQIGFVERAAPVYRLFAERWYLDHLYRLLVERVVDRGLSQLSERNERWVIDGTVDGLARGVVSAGRVAAGWGRAMIQYRMLVAFGALALLSLYYFW